MDPETPLGANHRLLASVGVGASGEVWRGRDIRTGEVVAAKVLHAHHARDREVVVRFVAERSLLTGLEHPSVVHVRDLIVDDGRLAIVMDYLPSSARQLLDELGTVPPAAAVGIMRRVMEALAYAHGRRVVHRDVKPDNILLSEAWGDLEPTDVQLTDFGIARIVGDGDVSTSGIGTPAYMAPELIETGQAGEASDVYSAGITLYELLAGRTPFGNAGTAMTIGLRHLRERPLPLDVPQPLAEVLDLMLAKDPEERPSAAELAEKLGEILPDCKDLPALEPLPDSELHQGTILKGVAPRPRMGDAAAPSSLSSAPSLGHSASDTVLKPLQELPTVKPVVTPPEPPPRLSRRKLIALIAAVVLVVGGAAVLIIPRVVSSQAGKKKSEVSAAPNATQSDQPLPTGLTVSRSATYDVSREQITLEIRYAAQNAPLTGPFLEVIPALGDESTCAKVTWTDGVGRAHSPTETGITTRCGWTLTTKPLAVQSAETVRATIPVTGDAPSTQDLNQWLSTMAKRTQAVITDAELQSTAYPVQRMTGIQLVAPPRVVSQVPLELTLLPVWPSGPDELNPLLHSPAVGRPTRMLTAIAGEDGVRFADGCGGALRVSSDGLTVSTVSISPSCRVNAQVGNFSFVSSNEFVITARS